MRLTPHELEIFPLVIVSKTNKARASEIYISYIPGPSCHIKPIF